MWFLAYKNIQRRRTQALVTIVLTMVTIYVFTVVFGIMQVMQEGISLSRDRLGADVILLPTASGMESEALLFTANPENVYMNRSVLSEVGKLGSIDRFTPQFYAQTLALDCCSPGEEIRIIGVDFATDFVLTPHFTGKSERIAETNEIILGNNFPEGLVGASYLVLGEQFIVQNRLQATGSGMDDTIFMEIDACRELANTSPYLNINWKGEDPMELISVVMVKLKEGVTPEQFTKEVRDADIKAKIVFTDTTISAVQNQFTVLLRILIAFWAALVLITAISLFGRFNALARERKKEIGLLRAIGMTGRDIFGLIVIECSMMSALGGVIGSVLATLSMGSIIESLKSAFLLSPSVWTPSIAASGCAMGILVALVLGVLSAAYPAVKSAALDPQVAMTEGEL